VYLFIHFRHFDQLKVYGIILIFLGIISLFAMGGEKVMVDEIAREYRIGADISERHVLNGAYILNLIFSLSLLFFTLKTFQVEAKTISEGRVEEIIFTLAQYMGIISGGAGILLTFNLIGRTVLPEKLWVYVPFYGLFLIPYALIVLYWLSLKVKQKISNWYDEKQWQDVLKSSLTTLILSVPGLGLFLFLNVSSKYYFFLYYIFLVLFIFSCSTLYFFKFKDT
jgi:hypothetical protein